MTLFYAERGGRQIPLFAPDDVRPFLGKPDRHWKAGYSAMELARCWFGANAIPPQVAAVLGRCETWEKARLLLGLYELQTKLPTPGFASQTDLLAVCELPKGLGILAVEGKVNEDFDDPVDVWLVPKPKKGRPAPELAPDGKPKPGANRVARLKDLCGRLGLDSASVGSLRYQLLHRTVAALLEAQRMAAKQAVFVVHSFARTPQAGHYADFVAFVGALGLAAPQPNDISEPIERDEIELRFAWVAEPLPVS